ncbi:MAG: DSD1 family PLP-dependent enzyme [Anaerolineae bacterium]|nr:DSD1 family PLP-dependent enzyme [Anaerolineae bacterium]
MNLEGSSKWDLDTPALVLDLDMLEANLAFMARFMAGASANLRPHAKTHKCAEIGRRQLEAGAVGITCAKLGEAEALAHVAPDILIANQIVGPTKIGRLVRLRRRTDVMVAVDDAGNVDELSQAAGAAGVSLRVLVEVDVGMGRCGVATAEEALALARRVDAAPGLVFSGLQGYEGHAVMIPDFEQRRATAEKAMAHLTGVRRYIEENGLPVAIVSGGGTGTYNITGNYPGVDEVQAGSYVTMDARYSSIVPEFLPAMTVLASVISKPSAGRAITDAGMKAITPEFGMPPVVRPDGLTTVKLSEEHGTLDGPGATSLKLGDKVELIPSHGCTTINLHERYFIVQGDRVVDMWPIEARGRFT